MKIFCLLLAYLFCFSTNGDCENISIQPISPLPDFENIGGPAFGEPVDNLDGKGLVQYVTPSKIIINSKMYNVDPKSPCTKQITSGEIRIASIVSFKLNNQAYVNELQTIVKFNDIGSIYRISDDHVVYNDIYKSFSLYISYHDITGNDINRYDFDKGTFIGLKLNEDNEITSMWKLDGHYMY